MQIEAEPHLQHLYPSLQDKRVLIIESPLVADQIANVAKGMQNMQAQIGTTLPHNKGVEYPLPEYMGNHAIDFLVIHPHLGSLKQIDAVIKAGYGVVIINNRDTVSKTIVNKVKKWRKQGVPIIDKETIDFHPLELPEGIMKLLAGIPERVKGD
jgi:hypothetical protein